MRPILFAGIAAFGLAQLAASAEADGALLAEVNGIRAAGCGGRRSQPALRHDASLDRAAAAIASGKNLRDAMAAADYRALRSAMLEVEGPSVAAMGRTLAARGCGEIADPAWRDAGTATEPGRAFIVLAEPLEAPAASEAASVSARVLALVNEARARNRRCGFRRFDAVPPLAHSATLQRAAAAHAADMARRGVMDHAGGDGSTPAVRATRAGYSWRTVGENVATGQSTPEQVVAEWLDSPRHCSNIMDGDFTEMGVAVAESATGVFWAQVFGSPQP